MSDPRHHVRPGQPLSLAAEQVNALNRMMAGGRGFRSGESVRLGLPQSVGVFRIQTSMMLEENGRRLGSFGEAFMIKGAAEGYPAIATSENAVTPAMPVGQDVLTNASEDEKQAFRIAMPEAWHTGVSTEMELYRSRLDDAIAVCVEHESTRLAYAGFALCRVRVFSTWHRYARVPVYCGLNDSNAKGCLDSCAYGPVRISGYVQNVSNPVLGNFSVLANGNTDTPPPAWPSNYFAWAVVQL